MKNIKFHTKVAGNLNNQEAFEFNLKDFQKIIPQESVVLDIGAHAGYFSLLFAECVGENGKVIAFEPNSDIFSLLEKNVKDNNYSNIETHNLACTLENKKYIFNYTDPNVYGEGINGGYFNEIESKDKLKNIHSHHVEVNGVNINDFLNKNYSSYIDNIKFIKIDAEGYDKEIIKTLKPILTVSKPVIMTEAFMSLNEEEIIDFYKSLIESGYRIYDASPHNSISSCVGPLTLDEFKYYTYKIMNGENFLCFHQDTLELYSILPKIVSNKTAAVVSSRNDGYKEKERFIIHLTTFLEIFDEVIYVDWNSPSHSFLYDVINELPKTNKLKHIVIPKEIHNMFSENIPDLPNCYDSLALNIALRRTDAEWITVTTLDIIPPLKKDFLEFLQTCNRTTFYTLSRRETEYENVIKNKDKLDKYREYLSQTTQPRHFPARVTPNDHYSIINCCGDFQLAHRNIFLKVKGFEENMCYKCFIDTNIQKKAVLHGFELKAHYDLPLYHMSHKNILPQGGNTEDIHEVAKNDKPPVYNDPWVWVEYFTESQNDDSWGLGNTEIEFEII